MLIFNIYLYNALQQKIYYTILQLFKTSGLQVDLLDNVIRVMCTRQDLVNILVNHWIPSCNPSPVNALVELQKRIIVGLVCIVHVRTK